jgi:DNA modification methylase
MTTKDRGGSRRPASKESLRIAAGRSASKESLRIADLVVDPNNRRTHNPRNVEMIVAALKDVGAARSIVIDEDDVVLAGNGVTAAAAAAGITKVRVIDAAGDEIIAVRRRGLSAAAKRSLAMYDNRTAELAEWNADQLAADQAAGLDLTPWFSEDELAAIVQTTIGTGLTDPDEVPEARPTTIARGDLFALGRHRLLCGDCTDGTDVARLLDGVVPHLMVTDPPYGVSYDPAWRARAGVNKNKGKMGAVTGDNRSDWRAAWALFPGTVGYIWHGGLHAREVQESLEAAGFEIRSQIIWVKDRFALSRGHYHWQHEPCWYVVKGQGHWTGDRAQSTVWRINARDDSGLGHSTQKPVEAMRRPLENNSSPGHAVYDPFVGSGTTVIACEQTGRSCLAIDIDPTYVQVAVDRWEAFTGEKATPL